MKKFVITTALALTLTTNANAYDRFNNLRPSSEPTIEVNYAALRYLAPELFSDSTQAPIYGKSLGNNKIIGGKIHAMPRTQGKPEKIISKPVNPIKGTENKPEVTIKPIAQIAAPEKTTANIVDNSNAPKIISSQKAVPKITNASDNQNTAKTPVIKKPTPEISSPKNLPLDFPKGLSGKDTKPVAKNELVTPPATAKSEPLAIPTIPKETPPELPTLPKDIKAEVEEIKQNEFPKLADIDFPKPTEQMPLEAPKPMEMPSLPEINEIAPPPPPQPATDSNLVVLPPLFPNDSTKSTEVASLPTPTAPSNEDLPSLDKLFAEKIKEAEQQQADASDIIAIPQLPNNEVDDLPLAPTLPEISELQTPSVPAPEISNVQINNQIASAPTPAPATIAKDTSYSIPLNETEVDFPLSEYSKLDSLAGALKADNNLVLNISAYASGSVEQSSQAKRTSLSRALSARKYLLQNGITSDQIIINPYGNKSGSGVPDRVDLQLSKKIGA